MKSKLVLLLTAILFSSTAFAQEPYALGADISWIPQRESENVKYAHNGQVKDAVVIFKEQGFNYIRLRLFVDPTATIPNQTCDGSWCPSPYSTKGFCGLESTIAMAKRVKASGMKLLLDFHYSDTWADPGKQYKPVSWNGLNFTQLTEKVRTYTKETLEEFKKNGVLPDMVQIGNEVINGMIHPDGSGNNANFARLVNAGIKGAKEVDPNIKIMMHTVSEKNPSNWLSTLKTNLNSVEAGAANKIDVIGLSYYPRWHGDLNTLSQILTAIANNHNIKIAVVEYADKHREVNDLVFNLPQNKGFGTFVWEPEEFSGDNSLPLFDWKNNRRESNALFALYPKMAQDFLPTSKPETTLTKEGAGNATQTVELGNAIVSFSYSWTNATSVSVTGLPKGVNANINNTNKTVTISGTPTETGTFSYTVTTTGSLGDPVTKGGTITVENKVPEPATIGRVGSGGARSQTVTIGKPITTIIFNFTNATSIRVIGNLPDGITADIVNNQLLIGGTPREIGVFSFTLETIGGTPNATDPGGTITVTEDTSIAKLEFEGELYQDVFEGDAIKELLFTWGAGTNDVRIEGLPAGLTTSKEGKSVKIKGIPASSTKISVTTVGNGEPITIEVFINLIPSGVKRIAYITDPSAGNYLNDTRILPALKACSDFYVAEIDAQQQKVDFSMYDLVIISEVPLSSSPIMRELEKVDKPVLNMKLHVYKVSDETWGWADNGYGDNMTATNIVVNSDMQNHPIFKDVTFINGNEVQMLSSVNEKGMTYMNSGSFRNVSGGAITPIANIKGEQQVSILEIATGTTINGTTLSNDFIQIGLNSSSYANVTGDGVSVVLNACYYLLGIGDAVNIEESGLKKPVVQVLTTGEKISVTIQSSTDDNVSLGLFNVKGYSYLNQDFSHPAGKEKYELDRKGLPSGIYILVVKTTDLYHVEKILLK